VSRHEHSGAFSHFFPPLSSRSFHSCQQRLQWIDLPPPFHLPAYSSHRSGSPLPRDLAASSSSYFSEMSSSSPPIFKAPNKFFDSLSNAEKVRARAIGGRNSLSGGSLASLGVEAALGAGEKQRAGSNVGGLRPTKVMPTQDELGVGSGETGGGASTPRSGESKSEGEEHSVELQFESENIIPFAHYGYVVRPWFSFFPPSLPFPHLSFFPVPSS
jgi:hypothetical protein